MYKKLYIVTFMVIISIPLIGMLWYESDMGAEKRHAKAPPAIMKEGEVNLQFFEELTEYFSDAFAYRQELVTADAWWKKEIFQTSNTQKVIVGKNDWLYFEETMDDYLGRNTLSERGAHNCAKVLALLEEGAREQGCQFVFASAPNKNSLYPDNMPDRYVKENEINNYDKLMVQLDKQGVSYVDLKKVFLQQDKVLYHNWDTHWNNEGAALACGVLLDYLEKDHIDYSDEAYTLERNFSADLWGMLYPKSEQMDENVVYERQHIYSYCNDVKSTEDMFIQTENAEGSGNLVMFRDSFGNALIPFVADEYENAYFTKAVPYDWTLLEEYAADTVMIEITERHIASLHEEAPVMEAVETSLDTDVTDVDNSESTLQYQNMGERYVIYGTLDSKYVTDDADIYIRIQSEDGEQVYEAFPAAYGMSGEEGNEDYRYTMYLSADKIYSGCEIEVIAGTEEMYFNLQKMQVE